jgi:RHS repeat-associated protein
MQAGHCYDAICYKFTGKERDTESGLDNFGARYNASSMGRVMSVDPIFIEAHRLGDPQQLNLYSYVRNSPTLTDSTGMLIDLNCSEVSAGQCARVVDDFNNRQGARFKVDRDPKTGQLNVVGGTKPGPNWSPGEVALYNAIKDPTTTGTLVVKANDPSFDFEKYDKDGQNLLDSPQLAFERSLSAIEAGMLGGPCSDFYRSAAGRRVSAS